MSTKHDEPIAAIVVRDDLLRLKESHDALLEALKKIVGGTVGGIQPDMDTEACEYFLRIARAAIAAAESN